MAKVSVVARERARAAPLPPGFAGKAAALAYVDGPAPIHLHLIDLPAAGALTIGPLAGDCAVYLWDGAVTVGDRKLPAGSSMIVEHGARLALSGAGAGACLLCFAGTTPPPGKAGGAVHLLPAAAVPRLASEPGASGVSGGLHADADCPTCAVWLHENRFPAGPALSPEQAARGIHAHSEDEIIFVTSGAMRLGTRLVGPGTALAIAADTLYGFTPGPDGLGFVNFRAAMPGDIRFAHGASISETGYWRERVARPVYAGLPG
jgi:hypothetical protein